MDRVKAGAALAAGLAMAELDVPEFWLRYFALGGGYALATFPAYLAGNSDWDAREHNIAALALNEYLADQGMDHPVRYTDEL
jgi:hypothetical protein